MSSQRNIGFNGGIQNGTTAYDRDSHKLDQQVKNCRDKLQRQFPQLTMVTRLSKEQKIQLVGDDCFGFAPDGGCWFKDGKLIAVFEAKKQGRAGNAHERWWDNAVTAKYINPDVYYITFCTREGAKEGECLEKMSRKAKIMMGSRYRFHLQPEGFTETEVFELMQETLQTVELSHNVV